jgi:hypothetical protein
VTCEVLLGSPEPCLKLHLRKNWLQFGNAIEENRSPEEETLGTLHSSLVVGKGCGNRLQTEGVPSSSWWRMEIALGLLIGIVTGATGVSGGTHTVPALILLIGYEPRLAVATALIYAVAVTVWVSLAYILKKRVNFRILAYVFAGGIPGGSDRRHRAGPTEQHTCKWADYVWSWCACYVDSRRKLAETETGPTEAEFFAAHSPSACLSKWVGIKFLLFNHRPSRRNIVVSLCIFDPLPR